MASYKLFIKPSAAKEIEVLPKQDRQKVIAKIDGVLSNPRPAGCEKLSGQEQYRIRQGRYRILYTINNMEIVTVVIKTAHRKEAYL